MSIISELNNIRKQTYYKRSKSYFGEYKTVEEYDEIISEYKEQRDKINIDEINYRLSQCNNKLKGIDSEFYHLLFVFKDTESEELRLHNQLKQLIDERIDLTKRIDEYNGIDKVINNVYKEKQFVIEVDKKLDEMKPSISLIHRIHFVLMFYSQSQCHITLSSVVCAILMYKLISITTHINNVN